MVKNRNFAPLYFSSVVYLHMSTEAVPEGYQHANVNCVAPKKKNGIV